MRDPISIGNSVIDRSEIAAVLRQDGKLLVFLRSSDRPLIMADNFSKEEIQRLVGDGTA